MSKRQETARTYLEPIGRGYRRSPRSTHYLVREWLDAAGNVARWEIVTEVSA